MNYNGLSYCFAASYDGNCSICEDDIAEGDKMSLDIYRVPICEGCWEFNRDLLAELNSR